MGAREFADRDGGGRPGELATPRTRSACSMRPPRCFDTRAPWFLSWTLYLRAFRGSAARGTPMKQSRWCANASRMSGSSATSSRSCTRWSRSQPRQRAARETTRGRREFWALQTPSRDRTGASVVPTGAVRRPQTSGGTGGTRATRPGSVDLEAYAAGRLTVDRFVDQRHRQRRRWQLASGEHGGTKAT